MNNEVKDWVDEFYNLNPDAVKEEVETGKKEKDSDVWPPKVPRMWEDFAGTSGVLPQGVASG